MTGKPKIDMKRVFKYSWILANVSLLQLGLGSYVLYPDYTFTSHDAVLYLILLSFPSSIPTVILTASYIDGYPPILYPPFDYITICVVAFISGYVQWFWCIPRFVKEREIISLHLTSPDRETLPIPATNPSRRRKSSQSNLPRATFYKGGLSPLERAIGIKRGQVYTHEVTNASGKTSQSSRRQSPSTAFHPSCSDRKAARRCRAANRNVSPQQ